MAVACERVFYLLQLPPLSAPLHPGNECRGMIQRLDFRPERPILSAQAEGWERRRQTRISTLKGPFDESPFSFFTPIPGATCSIAKGEMQE
jgi:hypothetical protein